MKIQYPEIRRTGKNLIEYATLLSNFAATYNEGKESRDQLKGHHIWLLDELIYYSQIVLAKDTRQLKEEGEELCQMDSQTWVRVNLSKYLLCRNYEQRKHPDTIKRWKKRLVEAGAIISSREKFEELKINKSHRNDVLINPDLLLIYDRTNPDFQPFTPYFGETEKRGIWKGKWANCSTVSCNSTLQESNKNEIMPGDNVDKGVSLPVDDLLSQTGDKTQQEATPNLNGSGVTSKQKVAESAGKSEPKAENDTKNKNRGSAGAPEIVENSTITAQNADKLAELKQTLAVDLYAFMLKMLFKFHNIYPAEGTMAIQYLADVYFSTVTSEEQGKWMAKCYRWRVSKAASWIKSHEYDFSNIYPCHYLDVENQFGFAATKGWWEKHQNDLARKEQERRNNLQRLQEQQSLQKVIDEYFENPTLSAFKRASEWINSVMPHRFNDFTDAINAMN